MKVAALTLSWNTLEATKMSVKSTSYELRTLKKSGIDVVHYIVDNGSDDGSKEWIKNNKKYDYVPIIMNENTGNSVGRNVVLDRLTDEDYLFMIDSDLVPVAGTFGAMLEFMEREDNKNIGNFGANYFTITTELDKTTRRVSKFDKIDNAFPSGIIQRPKATDIAFAGYGVFRAKLFTKHSMRFITDGPFTGPGHSGEDDKLGYDITKAGYKIQRFDDVVYFHNAGSSVRNMKSRGVDPNVQNRINYLIDMIDRENGLK